MTTITTIISDLPDVILSTIISLITDVRSRNSTSLVSHKWLALERSTRTSLTLRGNSRDLFMVPPSFRNVTDLDLSLLSPWGHPLFSQSNAPLLSFHLSRLFPSLGSFILYSRNPDVLEALLPHWRGRIRFVKLVRWHQRPHLDALGADLVPVFEFCNQLESLDLSCFYCWTDDVPPAVQAYPATACKLTRLNLLNPSFSEGFKANQVEVITKCCPNLREFLIPCVFDPRFIGFVADETVLCIAMNCPKLSVLHLADTMALVSVRGDPEIEGLRQEDVRISVATLIEFFSGLPLLEEFGMDISCNVRDSGPALEVLNTKCPKLRCLKLGCWHGISVPVESKLDGVALCQRLESLSIRNVGDLTDMGLIAIGRGCCRLVKFEVQGCKKITVNGMRTLSCLLRRTLVEVKISCCKNLGAVSSVKALEPIQDRIQKLHIDCVWDSIELVENVNGIEYNFDLNQSVDCETSIGKKRKRRQTCDLIDYDMVAEPNGFYGKPWEKLRYLSLWFSVGELLTPLASIGLEDCPNLEEIVIKAEGDSRNLSKPSQDAFGLSSLIIYPKLLKMHLDCSDVIGYANTAPSGLMDLSLWERFYLFGIGHLCLKELDYWPPQDRDVNQRRLTLPGAGLLQGCATLRKLFIHGTANEHFMGFLLKIPNLRDVQLREDYYPAPDNDMSTEMRADSCSRFEDALNRRRIED